MREADDDGPAEHQQLQHPGARGQAGERAQRRGSRGTEMEGAG